MNRRSLLSRPMKTALTALDGGPVTSTKLPPKSRSGAGLDPYRGPWGREQAAHLLRRTLFGPTRQEIEWAANAGLNPVIHQLMAPWQPPDPPLNPAFNDPAVPIGQTWINADINPGVDFYRQLSLRAWWVGQMIGQGVSLREKMTLFWHNHFATELNVYNDPRYGYIQNSLFREMALGNFKTLVERVTLDPAMLRYLNGNLNIVGRPNENYARELFELFTIGKGPQIGPGNYTHYTEDDVVAAAKVLTGWLDQGFRPGTGPIRVTFFPILHDTSNKQFSSAFQNRVISNNGNQEYLDLINLIFAQRETARYICRKLYRWFVYYIIDAQTEQNVIEPMATLLINSNFEVKPVLEALLRSEHFFDVYQQGCVIKNPLDFVVSLVRQTGVVIPDGSSNLEGQYVSWYQLVQRSEEMQMQPFDPPAVAGWPAYHQAPQYYESWITSATLTSRARYTETILNPGYFFRGGRIIVDPLPLVQQVSDPMDPNVLVREFAELYYPRPLELSQLDYLKAALLPGLPDYEWALEYGDYLLDPNNRVKRDAVVSKLQALLRTMFALAEYHLS